MNKLFGGIAAKLIGMADLYRIKKYKDVIKGQDYRLGNKVYMSHCDNISIGKGTYINGGYVLASANARIIIGENCLLSYNIHIRTDMHECHKANKLIHEQGNYEKDIIIEDDVWIGFGAQIMPGVTIMKGSVIGAGAIVTHSTEPYSINVGVPARKIGKRE